MWDAGKGWGKGGNSDMVEAMWQILNGRGPVATGQGLMQPQPPSETEVFYGSIKSINAEKGWGFIECDALQAKFGRDVFVPQTAAAENGLQQGMHVTFNVTMAQKGIQAVNVKPTASPAQTSGRIFNGTVKSFNGQKGWGFITCPQAAQLFHSSEIFVHTKQNNGVALEVGMPVKFQIDISGGRASAKSVVPTGPGTPTPAVSGYGAATSTLPGTFAAKGNFRLTPY